MKTLENLFKRIRQDGSVEYRIRREGNITSIRPFSLFLLRALNASEHMETKERAEWIANVWKHKSKYYSI